MPRIRFLLADDPGAGKTIITHIFKAFKTVPYLNVRSPLYGSGKSTVFELLNEVVARPYMAGDDSIAFVFREIDETSPTKLSF